MKLSMFSVFDAKAEVFMVPFFMQNANMALRDFANVANDKSHALGKNPEDYSLFLIGTFDQSTGMTVLEKSPKVVSTAIALVRVAADTLLERPVGSANGRLDQIKESLQDARP